MSDSILPPLFPDQGPQDPRDQGVPRPVFRQPLEIGGVMDARESMRTPVLPERFRPVYTQEERDQAFVRSFAFASRHDARVRAEIRKLGKGLQDFGVTEAEIRADMPTYRRLYQSILVDREKLREFAPVVYDMMTDPRFAAVAWDKTSELGAIEGLLGDTTKGWLLNRLGKAAAPAVLRDLSPEEWEQIARLQQKIEQLPTADTMFLTPAATLFGQLAEGAVTSLPYGLAGAGIGAGAGALGFGVGAGPGAAAGFGYGLRAGYLFNSYQVNSGLAAIDMHDRGYDMRRIRTSMVGVGIGNAALDYLGAKGASRIANNTKIGELFRKATSRNPLDAMTVTDTGKEILKNTIGGTLSETATETLQTINEMAFEELARGEGQESRITEGKFGEEIWATVSEVTQGMTVIAGVGGGYRAVRLRQREKQAVEVTQEFLDKLAKAPSELAEQEPDEFRRFMQEVVKDSGAEVVKIPLYKLREKLKQAGISEDDAREVITEMKQAEELEGELGDIVDVVIPLARLKTDIVPRVQLFEALKPALRLDDDPMSFEEFQQKEEAVQKARAEVRKAAGMTEKAEGFGEDVTPEEQEAMDTALNKHNEQVERRRRVRDAVSSMVRAAGLSGAEATFAIEMHMGMLDAYWRDIDVDLGLEFDEWFDTIGYQVVNTAAGQQAARVLPKIALQRAAAEDPDAVEAPELAEMTDETELPIFVKAEETPEEQRARMEAAMDAREKGQAPPPEPRRAMRLGDIDTVALADQVLEYLDGEIDKKQPADVNRPTYLRRRASLLATRDALRQKREQLKADLPTGDPTAAPPAAETTQETEAAPEPALEPELQQRLDAMLGNNAAGVTVEDVVAGASPEQKALALEYLAAREAGAEPEELTPEVREEQRAETEEPYTPPVIMRVEADEDTDPYTSPEDQPEVAPEDEGRIEVEEPAGETTPDQQQAFEGFLPPEVTDDDVDVDQLELFAEEPAETDEKGNKFFLRTMSGRTFRVPMLRRPGDKSPENMKRPLRHEQLGLAAQALEAGQITREQYDALVDLYLPIRVFEEVPPLATREQLMTALDQKKTNKPGKKSDDLGRDTELADGERTASRQDIPSYRDHGLYVVSVHKFKSGSGSGPILGYNSTIRMTDVVMGQGIQKDKEGVVKGTKAWFKTAKGAKKNSFAVLNGNYVKATPEENYELAQQVFNDPAWRQVGMNPERHGYFYDRQNREPVIAAEEIIQIGGLVLAKNPTYAPKSEFLYSEEQSTDADDDVVLEQTEQLSTRQPSGRDAVEDPMQDMLVVTADVALSESFKGNTQKIADSAATIRALPFMRIPKNADDRKVIELFIKHMEENLELLFEQMTPGERRRARLWYDGGRKYVERWADRYGLSTMQAAGAVAILSPQKNWFVNMSMAERMLDILAHVNNKKTSSEMLSWSEMTEAKQKQQGLPKGGLVPTPGIKVGPKETKSIPVAEMQERIRGKTLQEIIDSGDMVAASYWVRLYDAVHNERTLRVLSPEGGVAGTWSATIQWQDYDTVAKVISVFRDGSRDNISQQIGNAHKVRSFWNNLYAPNSLWGHVTVDTHAVGAGLLLPVSSKSKYVTQAWGGAGAPTSAETGILGFYPFYAEAIARVARRHGMLPREIQSITWEQVRRLFTDVNKRTGVQAETIRKTVAERQTDPQLLTKKERERAEKDVTKLEARVAKAADAVKPKKQKLRAAKTDKQKAAAEAALVKAEAKLKDLRAQLRTAQRMLSGKLTKAEQKARTADELKRADEIDLVLRADQIWARYAAGKITRRQAFDELTEVFGVDDLFWKNVPEDAPMGRTYNGESATMADEATRDQEPGRQDERVAVQVEAKPNLDPELMAIWETMTPEQEARATDYILRTVVPKVLRGEGSNGAVVAQRGAWMGEPASSISIMIDEPDKAVAIADRLGRLLQQEGMYVMSAKPGEGLQAGVAIAIGLPAGTTTAEIDRVYTELLWPLKGPGGDVAIGHSTQGSQMLIGVNPEQIGLSADEIETMVVEALDAGGVDATVQQTELFVSERSAERDYGSETTTEGAATEGPLDLARGDDLTDEAVREVYRQAIDEARAEPAEPAGRDDDAGPDDDEELELFSEEVEPEPREIPEDPIAVLHRISEYNLQQALDLGGLAAPSMGVTSAEDPYTGYGDIILIGTERHADPEASVAVFAGDGWTPTFPQVEAGSMTGDAVLPAITAAADLIKVEQRYSDNGKPFSLDMRENIVRVSRDHRTASDYENLLRGIENSTGLRIKFLEERGIPVPMKSSFDGNVALMSDKVRSAMRADLDVLTDQVAVSSKVVEFTPMIMQAYDDAFEQARQRLSAENRTLLDEGLQRFEAEGARGKWAAIQWADDIVEEQTDDAYDPTFDELRRIEEYRWRDIDEETGLVYPGRLWKHAKRLQETVRDQFVDQRALFKMPERQSKGFSAWQKEQTKAFREAKPRSVFRDKQGRQVEATLENVTEYIINQQIQNADEFGEEFTVGSARARKLELKTLQDVQSERAFLGEAQHRLDRSSLTEPLKTSAARLEKAFNAVNKTPNRSDLWSLENKFLGDLVAFEKTPTVDQARDMWERTLKKKFRKIGPNDRATILAWLSRERSEETPNAPAMSWFRVVVDISRRLRNMAVEYMEAKVLRPVPFSEIAGAILDSDESQDYLEQQLEERGVEVFRAESGTEDAMLFTILKELDAKQPDDDRVLFSEEEHKDPEKKRTRRGRYVRRRIGERIMRTIELMEDANESTIYHELAHVFFDMRLDSLRRQLANPDGPQSKVLRETMLAFFEAMGIGPEGGTIEERLQAWDALSKDEQVPYHEAIARNFEVYLQTGEAPTRRQKRMFQRIAGWMRVIYKNNVLRINQIYRELFGRDLFKITPRVQRAFDSMVAAEEDIQNELDRINTPDMEVPPEARAADDRDEDGQPLPVDDRDEPEDDVNEMRAEARDDAIDELTRELLSDAEVLDEVTGRATSAVQSEARQVRRQLKENATDELKSKRVHRLRDFLRSGRVIDEDGNETQKLDENTKLNTKQVRAIMPKAKLRDLGGSLTSPDGIDLQVAVDLFGYESATEMLEDLRNSMTLTEEVDARVQKQMLEAYGNLATPEAVRDTIQKAIYNETKQMVVLRELEDVTGAALPRNVTLQATRDVARQRLAKMKLRDMQPTRFQNDAMRARREAFRQLRFGNKQKAAQAFRAELLYNAMVREAALQRRNAEQRIRRVEQSFARGRDAQLAKTRDMRFVYFGRAMLNAIGLGSQADVSQQQLAQVAEYDPEFYEANAELITALDKFAKDNVLDLTGEELTEALDLIETAWDRARTSRTITIAGKRMDRDQVARQLAGQLQDLGKADKDMFEGQVDQKTMRSWRFAQMWAQMKRFEQAMMVLDGGKEGGMFARAFYEPLREALDRGDQVLTSYYERLQGLMEEVNTLEQSEETPSEIVAPELGGYVFGRRREGDNGAIHEIVTLIANLGNRSNANRLMAGYEWSEPDKDGNYSIEPVLKFLNRLLDEGVITKSVIDLAQGMMDTFESMKPQFQQALFEVEGRYVKEIEARPFTLTVGGEAVRFAGGYVPMRYDPIEGRTSKKQQDEARANAAKLNLSSSATKERAAGTVPEKVSLRLDTLMGTFAEHVRYIHVVPKVKQVRDLLDATDVSDMFGQRNRLSLGEALRRMNPGIYGNQNSVLDLGMYRASSGSLHPNTAVKGPFSRAMNALRRRMGSIIFTFHLRNAAENNLALIGALTTQFGVKPRYVAAAWRARYADLEYIISKSSMMHGRLQKGAQQIVAEDFTPSALREKMSNRVGYWAPRFTQQILEATLWKASHDQWLAESRPDGLTDEEAVRQASSFADRKVRLNLGSGDILDAPGYEGAYGELGRMLTQFTGWFAYKNSMGQVAWERAKQEGGLAGYGRFAWNAFAMFYLEFMFSSAMAAWLYGEAEDDDEASVEAFLIESMIVQPVRMAMAGAVPIAGEMAGGGFERLLGLAARAVDPDTSFELGRGVRAPRTGAFDWMARNANTALKALQGEFKGEELRAAVELAASILGRDAFLLPAYAGRQIEYGVDLLTGAAEPQDAEDVLRGFIQGQ